MKRNLFRRIAALVMALALCAGGASAAIADFAIEQPAVYATKHGTYYHYDPVCSGMKNAQATTAGDALTEGKTPCPVCVSAAEQPTVYATKHGTYYHYDPVCSGMKNAQATTANDALAEGKTACPVCIPAVGASVFVSEAPEEFASFAASSN